MDPKSISQPNIEIVIDQPKLENNIDTNNIKTTINNSSSIGFHYNLFVDKVLVKFHAGYFRISFSLCAQVLLWKTLIQFIKQNNQHYYEINPMIFHILPSIVSTLLWSISAGILVSLSILFALKCFHHFEKIKAEFLHHVGVNYFFSPWISCLLLLETCPLIDPKRNNNIDRQILWWVFVVPIIMLDIKIYGQWLTKGKRFLSRVANPTCQLSIIANLVASKVAIDMGWLEIALCLFSLAMVHYLVLFITLYQRLPGSSDVSMLLRPVFFLFIATPSMASLAWASINGTFDEGSKMLFFLSFFLFLSLVCRPILFKKSMKKFSIAWWAYSFPITLLALASIAYAQEVKNEVTQMLALVLSIISILVSLALTFITSFKINKLLRPIEPNTTFN